MNDAVSKMQLVDSSKLNEFLVSMKKQNEFNEIKRNIDAPAEMKLQESYNLLNKEAKKKNNAEKIGENMITFLKRKQKYKQASSSSKKAKTKSDEEGDEDEVDDGRKIRPNKQSKKRLENFFKKWSKDGKLKINGISADYSDTILDFSNNVQTERNFNLSKIKRTNLLKELAKENMPAHYIRNNLLKEDYKKIKSNLNTPSAIPVASKTPPVRRRTALFPYINPTPPGTTPRRRPPTPSDLYTAKRVNRRK